MTDVHSAFERKLDSYERAPGIKPQSTLDAARFVHDTMDLARAAALSVFGEHVSHDVVLAVFDRICAKQSQAK